MNEEKSRMELLANKYGLSHEELRCYVDMCTRIYHQQYYITGNTPLRMFVYGGTGSGKDTVADILKNKHNMAKLRLAFTIKNVIVETQGYGGYADLEFHKRRNPKMRDLHYDISDRLLSLSTLSNQRHKHYSLNVCMSLITRQHGLFDITNKIPLDYVVSDARMMEEILLLLCTGHYGIFLTRRTGEYVCKEHSTETGIYECEFFDDLKEIFGDQILLVNNPIKEYNYDYHQRFEEIENDVNVINVGLNCGAECLIENIENNLSRFKTYKPRYFDEI